MARKFSLFCKTSSKNKSDGLSGKETKDWSRKNSLPNHIEKLENHGEKCEEFVSKRRNSTKDEAIWYQNGKFINR